MARHPLTTATASAAAVVLLLGGCSAAASIEAPSSPATTAATSSGSGAASAGGATGSPGWVATAAKVAPSTVSLQVSSSSGKGSGSGIVLDVEGHVLTNHHVAAGLGSDATILVTMMDGLSHPATLVGSDPDTDVAIVKMTNPPKDLVPAALGSSAALKVGQPVMAIGSPLGLQNTVTTGIVSALHRPVVTQQKDPDADQGFGANPMGETKFSATSAIQTDASVNPGNSGGPLVNAAGEVIGINSSIASNVSQGERAGSIGLGFAIPMDTARAVADQLLKDGKAAHPRMGITVRNDQVQLEGDVLATGARVGDVVPDSPADKAGFTADDVILSIDGVRTGTATAVIAYVRSQTIGSEHTVQVVRGTQTMDLTITLSEGK